MVPRRAYVLTVPSQEDYVELEDVRTGRRARLADLSEIGPQIERWLERNPAPRPAPSPTRRSGS